LKSEMTATTTTVQNRGRMLHRRDALRREIVLALTLKAAVIYGLWYAFFSEPVDDGLTGTQVGNVLFDTSRTEPQIDPRTDPRAERMAQDITINSHLLKPAPEEN
jgi:hypothetical protein